MRSSIKKNLVKNERYLSLFGILLIIILTTTGAVIFLENDSHYFNVLDVNYSQDGNLIISAIYTSPSHNEIEIKIWDTIENSVRTVGVAHICDAPEIVRPEGINSSDDCVHYKGLERVFDRSLTVSLSPDNQYAIVQSYFLGATGRAFLQIWEVSTGTLITNLWWADYDPNPKNVIWIDEIPQFSTQVNDHVIETINWTESNASISILLDFSFTEFDIIHSNPILNEKGTKLAYRTWNRNDETYKLVVRDLVTKDVQNITIVENLGYSDNRVKLKAWSLDETWVLATHLNFTQYDKEHIYMWNTQTQELLSLPVGNFTLMDWSPNLEFLLLSDSLEREENVYTIWNTQTSKLQSNITEDTWKTLALPFNSFQRHVDVALSPDGEHVAVRGSQASLIVVDLTTQTVIQEYKPYDIPKLFGFSLTLFSLILLIGTTGLRKKFLNKKNFEN